MMGKHHAWWKKQQKPRYGGGRGRRPFTHRYEPRATDDPCLKPFNVMTTSLPSRLILTAMFVTHRKIGKRFPDGSAFDALELYAVPRGPRAPAMLLSPSVSYQLKAHCLPECLLPLSKAGQDPRTLLRGRGVSKSST